jgi:hypothetical protein
MASKSSLRFKLRTVKWTKLLTIASSIGFFSSLMATSLKLCTERFEELFFEAAMRHRLLLFVFPTVGLGARKLYPYTVYTYKKAVA